MIKRAIFAGIVSCATGAAHADLVITLESSYTGSSPSGNGPWLTATFSQTGVDTVRLTLESNLTGSEFISKVFFNVDPAQTVTGTFNSALSSGTFGTPSIGFDPDNHSAGGGSLYDALVNFDIAPPLDRFGNTDVAVFDLTGAGLTEGDFNFFSLPGGGGLAFRMAAHVQGIGAGAGDSGWISSEIIPLPPAAWAGLACLGGVMGMSWLRRRKMMA